MGWEAQCNHATYNIRTYLITIVILKSYPVCRLNSFGPDKKINASVDTRKSESRNKIETIFLLSFECDGKVPYVP